ncbi:MAG: lipoyl(octanoyl) transferase LipB [Pseudomonadales bacterium]
MPLPNPKHNRELSVSNYLAEPTQALPYSDVWDAMRTFSRAREAGSRDQLWLLEHEPVYTLGQGADAGHVLNASDIPVLRSDRGGQVTYHGPGQLMIYLLADMRALQKSVRVLVETLELAVIDALAGWDIVAEGNRSAPGVYVNGAKIAALGLRVTRGYCYHGLCFNYALDLEPFERINPCGYANMPVTQLRDLLPVAGKTARAKALPGKPEVALDIVERLCLRLGYAPVYQRDSKWERTGCV